MRHESVTEYNSDGEVVYTDSLEYNGTWMGECFLTVTVKSAYPIDFHIGDYIMYRGEKFVINYDPSVIKKARRGTYGEGFTYDGIKFNALQTELTDIMFLDYVLGDKGVHYSSLPVFPFFAKDIDDYCDRLQVNTNRWCAEHNLTAQNYWLFLTPSLIRTQQRARVSDVPGLEAEAIQRWHQAYGEDFSAETEEKNVSVSVNNQTIWNALTLIKSDFGLNFINRGRSVIIGNAGLPTNHLFKYGKGEGLYEIERQADTEQQVITKLYGYGSEKNMPTRYYANLNTKGYLLITGDYHPGSTEQGLSVPLEGVSFGRWLFLDVEGDENTTIVWYGVKCMVGNVEFLANVETTNTDGGTVRLLAFNESAATGVSFNVNRTTQANINAVKSAIDGGADRVIFMGGVNIDKFPGDRKIQLTENLPNNMSVNCLMLPGFPNQSLYDWVKANGGMDYDDETGQATWNGYTAIFSKEKHRPYVLSLNAAEIGVREGIKTFDGSDDTEEVYPTIEGSGFDVVVDADVIADNGVFDGDTENIPNFNITLPVFPSEFNLKELVASGDNPSIDMKDGFCAGRNFKIASAKKDDSGQWICNVEREYDDLIQIYFPYSDGVAHGGSATPEPSTTSNEPPNRLSQW